MCSECGYESEVPSCRNCGHETFHDPKYGCEYERGDTWVTGNQPSQPTVLMAQGPCGCRHYEPSTAEDILSDCKPEEI
jgi:hypothetical protein